VCYTVTRLEGGTKRINTNGAWDQREGNHLWFSQDPKLPLTARHDVVLFQTEPLEKDLEITGHPIVELWFSTDGADADFVAKLVDVYPPSADDPDGFALAVSEGIQRAKFRDGFENPSLLVPGQVYHLRVEMRPLSNLFKKGHRLRVDITGSSFPHFDVNTHTGRNPSEDHERRVAHHTIHHHKEHPSRILLPAMPL
jgi:putative CocE/NonD family hydrolase